MFRTVFLNIRTPRVATTKGEKMANGPKSKNLRLRAEICVAAKFCCRLAPVALLACSVWMSGFPTGLSVESLCLPPCPCSCPLLLSLSLVILSFCLPACLPVQAAPSLDCPQPSLASRCNVTKSPNPIFTGIQSSHPAMPDYCGKYYHYYYSNNYSIKTLYISGYCTLNFNRS